MVEIVFTILCIIAIYSILHGGRTTYYNRPDDPDCYDSEEED